MTAKQVSTRQFVVVQFLVALAVKMFMLPALMLRVVGKDSYIVMLAWIAFEFIDLTFVLLLARRNPDKTMYDILKDAFGKIASRVIVAVFTLFVAMKGPECEAECAASDRGIRILGGRIERTVPRTLDDGSGRTLVLIRKAAPTPPAYPRAGAKIAKSPLGALPKST